MLGPARRMRHVLLDEPAGHAEAEAEPSDSDCGPRAGAAGHGRGPRQPAPNRWLPMRERMRATLERARRYARIIREDRLTQEELASREGVSGPRVNQVLSFLRLDPSILGDLTDLTSSEPIPSMDELFAIGRLPSGRAQVTRYRAICAALKGQRAGEQAQAARQRGFQHLFAQARGWQAALDAGTYRSLRELGRSEGLTAHRVAQVLDLLTLPSDVQAMLDSPADRLPAGLTQKVVKAIARLEGEEAKRAAFAVWWPGA